MPGGKQSGFLQGGVSGASQPIVDVRHRGESNLVIYLIGYGEETSGSELLVNEIGNYSGQTLVDEMPEGGYLLAVQADGPWTMTFSP